MEVVSTDKDSSNIISSEAKKCRQLLMMIESLYRTLLKLEDLSNPLAVATTKLVRVRCYKLKTSFIFDIQKNVKGHMHATLCFLFNDFKMFLCNNITFPVKFS